MLLTACSNSENGADNTTQSEAGTTTVQENVSEESQAEANQESTSEESAFNGFKPGIWHSQAADEEMYYIFNDDMKSGKSKRYAQETASAFTYEYTDGKIVFNYEDGDVYAPPEPTIVVNSEDSITIVPFEGVNDDFTFVSSESEENFEFPAFTSFEKGIWEGDGCYYYFSDESSGYTSAFGTGTGVGFTYEIDQNNVMFHMGAVDDETPAELVINSKYSITLKWSDGRTENLSYTFQPDESGFKYLEFAPFQAGVWLSSDNQFCYEFRDDQTGVKIDLETEMGSPFKYEIEKRVVSFRFGDAEAEPVTAEALLTEEGVATLDWADGTSETLTFVHDGDFDSYLASAQG